MLADRLDYVVGVDPHRDVHALAIVEVRTGGVVFETSVAALELETVTPSVRSGTGVSARSTAGSTRTRTGWRNGRAASNATS